MTPVNQTIFGEGGNCLQACVASLLDLPLERVPHIFRGCKAGDYWTQEQWDELKIFAHEVDYDVTYLDPDMPEDAEYIRELIESCLPYIALIPSGSTGYGHFVVMRGDELIHDPAPAGRSFKETPWLYLIFLSHWPERCEMYKNRLASAGLTEDQIKKVLDPMESFWGKNDDIPQS